jgi:hypothetical protein
MGEKFQYFKFQSIVNPFGIIFNTISLEKLIRRSVENRKFTENDIFFHNDLWHCFEIHSELSNPDKEIFLNNLNSIVESTHQHIDIVTLGTSWVYRNIESKEIVANCHKVPQKEFTKELLTVNQIEESLQNIISLVHSVNPNCKFIFTVSPVRHIKDGFTENTLSKAHLIAAIHKTINHHTSPISYFPSPSQTAIDYIWIKFFENYISESEFGLMNEICSIQKGLKHRPFNPNTASHQKFLNQLELKIKTIQIQHPFIKFF